MQKPKQNYPAGNRWKPEHTTLQLGVIRSLLPGLPINGNVLLHRCFEVLQGTGELEKPSFGHRYATPAATKAPPASPPCAGWPPRGKRLHKPANLRANAVGRLSFVPGPWQERAQAPRDGTQERRAPPAHPFSLTQSASPAAAGPPGCPWARARTKGAQSAITSPRPRREPHRTRGSCRAAVGLSGGPAAASPGGGNNGGAGPAAISRLGRRENAGPEAEPAASRPLPLSPGGAMAAAGPVDCHCHLAAPCFQTVRRGGAGGEGGGRGPRAEAACVSCRTWRPWCGRRNR